jgi:hypothetical protein
MREVSAINCTSRFFMEGDIWIEPAEPRPIDVIVEDEQPKDTGLLNSDGGSSDGWR